MVIAAAYRPSIIATTAAATTPQVNPPNTHGMPEAPSAAIAERLRRPIAIMIPHQIRPPTPQITRIHFSQAMTVSPNDFQAGRRHRRGGRRERCRRVAATWVSAWVHGLLPSRMGRTRSVR